MRKYLGDQKSIQARSRNGGQTWEGELYENTRVVKFTDATQEEVDELAAEHGMRLVSTWY
jgi:hypothetical protein